MICFNLVIFSVILLHCALALSHINIKQDDIYEKHTVTDKTESGCFFNNTHCDGSGKDPVPVIYNISLTLTCDEFYNGNITIQYASYSRPVTDLVCDYTLCSKENYTFCSWYNESCSQDVTEGTIDDWGTHCSGQSVCTLEDLSAQSMTDCGCGSSCPCLSRTIEINYGCHYDDDGLPVTTAEPSTENLPSTDITEWTSESQDTTTEIFTTTSLTTLVSTDSETTVTTTITRTTTEYQSTTEEEDSGGGTGVIILVVLGAVIIILIVIIIVIVISRKSKGNSNPVEHKEETPMDKLPDILLSESSLDPKPVTRHIHSKYIPDITFAYPEGDVDNNIDEDSLSGYDSYQAIPSTFDPIKSEYQHNIVPLTGAIDDGDSKTTLKLVIAAGTVNTNPGQSTSNNEDKDIKKAEPFYTMSIKKTKPKDEGGAESTQPVRTSGIEMVENTEYSLDEDQSMGKSTEELFRASAVEMVDNTEYSNSDEEISVRKSPDDDTNKTPTYSESIGGIRVSGETTVSTEESTGIELGHHDPDDSNYTYVYQHFAAEGRERSPGKEGEDQKNTSF